MDITWKKIVLQSSTKKQNHRKALPDHFRLVSIFVPRFNFTKNLKKQKKNFYQKKNFFSKMLENLKQHRGPLGTYCGKFFFNSSKPFRRYGFPPCTQLFESRTVLVFEWFFKCHSFMLLILFCPKFLRHICLGMV